MCSCVLSLFSRVWLFATLWTIEHQALLSMGFSRQEYWSRLPCPPPGDLPDPGIEPKSPVSPALQANSLPLSLQGSKSTILQYKYLPQKRLSRKLMEKEIATHSSTLAWKIPWTEEPGRLQSMGLQKVGHDWATSLSTFIHWRRKWQPTPVILPGESQGQWSLVGCRLWGRTESDTTEVT